ncbi:(2Fe-2S)-binding protein [Salinithrix halophila]|uniref:(2Fe-2S)-binding protein n=1 Tax=Salinithrix halophila TaxID=1485204 RepID=A0ABV8JLQ1_9BACL
MIPAQDRNDKQRRASLTRHPKPFLTLTASELTEPDRRDEVLAAWARRIGTEELPVAASMLAKRYAARLLSTSLHEITRLNRARNDASENLQLSFGEGWEVTLEWMDGAIHSCPEGDREVWREQAVRRLFSDNLDRVLGSLSHHVPASILWESARIYLHHFYETWSRETDSPAEQERIIRDFRYLTASGLSLTADGRTNPLAADFRCAPHPTKADQELRLRQTCCLYHRLPGAAPCINCPRVQKPACDSGKALLRSRP